MAVERLLPSGFTVATLNWDNGLFSNIDEAVANADGQYIGTSLNFDLTGIEFNDPVDLNSLSNISDIRLELRARWSDVPADSEQQINDGLGNSISVDLIINNISPGPIVVGMTDDGLWVNHDVHKPEWDSYWDAEDLDTARVTLTAYCYGGGGIHVDALELIITYTDQAPISITPDPGALTLTPQAGPVDFYEQFARPAVLELDFAGQAPSLDLLMVRQPGEALLRFTETVSLLDTTLSPAAAALTLGGQALIASRNETAAPAVEELDFTGQAPTATATDNHFGAPPRLELRLDTDAPASNPTNDHFAIPSRLRVLLVTQLPVLDLTENFILTLSGGSLTLTGLPPVPIQGTVTTPAAASLSLTTAALDVVPGFFEAPPAGSLSLAGYTVNFDNTDAALLLTGHSPTALDTVLRPVGGAALTLAGKVPLSLNAAEYTPEATLVLAGQAPTVDISTSFLQGSVSRLQRLTVDYTFESLGNPYEG